MPLGSDPLSPHQPTHTLPIEQHCPAAVALSRGYPDGCHILGHVHLHSLVGPVHPGARVGQMEHLQQWLSGKPELSWAG